jgi:hypothetical protein
MSKKTHQNFGVSESEPQPTFDTGMLKPIVEQKSSYTLLSLATMKESVEKLDKSASFALKKALTGTGLSETGEGMRLGPYSDKIDPSEFNQLLNRDPQLPMRIQIAESKTGIKATILNTFALFLLAKNQYVKDNIFQYTDEQELEVDEKLSTSAAFSKHHVPAGPHKLANITTWNERQVTTNSTVRNTPAQCSSIRSEVKKKNDDQSYETIHQLAGKIAAEKGQVVRSIYIPTDQDYKMDVYSVKGGSEHETNKFFYSVSKVGKKYYMHHFAFSNSGLGNQKNLVPIKRKGDSSPIAYAEFVDATGKEVLAHLTKRFQSRR